jgi:diguanylate cyclase (GGDEF)-like protein
MTHTDNIRRRLRRWFGVMTLLIVLIAIVTASFAAISVAGGRASAELTNHLARLDESLSHSVAAEHAAMAALASTRDTSQVTAFENAQDDTIDTMARLEDLGDAQVSALVGPIRSAHDAWADGWVTTVVERIEAGLPVDPTMLIQGDQRFGALQAPIAALEKFTTDRQDAALDSGLQAGVQGVIMIVGLLISVLIGFAFVIRSVIRFVSVPLERLIGEVEQAQATGQATFDVSREDEIGQLARAFQALHQDLDARYERARQDGQRASLFNSLSDRLSASADEGELAATGAIVLHLLVPGASGSICLMNPSANRLTVASSWGDDALEIGAVLGGAPAGCPAVRRSATHIVRGDGDPLAVRCAILPDDGSHQVCIPMLALGRVIGVLHLSSPATTRFDPEGVTLATRVAEQLGLALANARLTETLERLAMTDPLTGLENARSFDADFEVALRAAEASGRQLGVVFLDLDHFKQFNDSYGHPAGDMALRSLGRIVTATIRDGDKVARYGGEEFVVAVLDADLQQVASVAEKIRLAVEQMVVALGPGRFARVTASLGMASSASHGFDASTLLRTADAALYAAKAAGRNRVEIAGSSTAATPVPGPGPVSAAERRRARSPRTPRVVDGPELRAIAG